MYKKGGGKGGRHSDISTELNVSAISNIAVQLYEHTTGRTFRPNPQSLAVLGAVQYMLIPSHDFLCILDALPKETTLSRLEISMTDFNRFVAILENQSKYKDKASSAVVQVMVKFKQKSNDEDVNG